MSLNVINIGLICIGSEIRVPIVACNNNGNVVVPDAYVLIDVPQGLVFNSFSASQGVYDNNTGVWTIGRLNRSQCIVGELVFIVTDDRVGEFNFNYTISTTENCSTCVDTTECVLLKGISCSQLRKCDSDIAHSNILTCPQNTICPHDVSVNDGSCVAALPRTYQWLDLDLVSGTITGDPDNYTYQSLPLFTGQETATYGVYCNGILVDTAIVRFDVN